MSDCLAREAEPANGQGLSSGALENVLQPVWLKHTESDPGRGCRAGSETSVATSPKLSPLPRTIPLNGT